MSLNEFLQALTLLNINLTETQINSLETYKTMLQEYNKKFNLTSITKDEDIYLKHFYDSLTLIKATNLQENLTLLDIGTGAGFPGLVLKIVFPNLNVTLLDSNHKKISFLETVIKTLNLTNITCLNIRAEELPPTYREYFDIVTSRAVSSLPVLLELAIPYLKVNGYFLPLKAHLTEELKASNNALSVLNCTIIDTLNFKLPIENSDRTILKIKKNAPTSSLYPREYSKITKKPL